MDLKDFICQIVKSVLQCLKSSLMILNYLISLIPLAKQLLSPHQNKDPSVLVLGRYMVGVKEQFHVKGAGKKFRPNDRDNA